jgi:hypothetical protein
MLVSKDIPHVYESTLEVLCEPNRPTKFSAIIFSVIETTKENKLKTYEYLKFIFDKL